MQAREVFEGDKLALTLKRLAHEVLEHHLSSEVVCILGVQPRGVFLARRLHQLLCGFKGEDAWLYGDLDVTFYRDDFRRRDGPLLPQATNVNFSIEGRNVLLIDDVLFTGRTVQAALAGMLAFGRPRHVELLVLVERRRMCELPIEPKYVGVRVDTLNSEQVIVKWREHGGEDSVLIRSNEPKTV